MSSADLASAREEASQWRWPLQKVEVTSPYGRRSRDFHEGVDLKAAIGTPVFACADGTVLYAASRVRGYGRMIVLKHAGGLSTVYAHNSRLLVRKGQKVKRGQKLALAGRSGRATGPHLHFEIRKGVTTLNPSDLIAESRVALNVPDRVTTQQSQAVRAPASKQRKKKLQAQRL